MYFENNTRHYGFDLAFNSTPGTFAVTDFDRDGLKEITYASFDLQGIGVDYFEVKVLEFRDPVPDDEFVWIYEPQSALVDITAEIFANNPAGIPTLNFPRHMTVKDINGDGYEDLIIANHGFDRDPFPGGQNLIALSDGQGGLIDYSHNFEITEDFTHSMTVGDFDGDGRSDFFVGNLNVDGAYFVTLNGTEGLFNSFPLVPDANRYTRVDAFDVFGSGRDALFLGGNETYPDRMAIWSGTSWNVTDLPTFASAATMDFEFGDINDDGRTDVIVLSTSTNGDYQGILVEVLLQNAAGEFEDHSPQWITSQLSLLPQNNWAGDLDLGDFDGDGDLDMTMSIGFPDFDEIFWNEGGSFRLGSEFSQTGWGRSGDASSLIAEDIDGDGKYEIIAIGLGTVTIHEALPEAEVGTNAADRMRGGAIEHNILFGAGGDDTLEGGNSQDTLVGGAGNDILISNDARAVLYGDEWDVTQIAEADQVFRLYKATLDRAPDAAGYMGWTQLLHFDALPFETVVYGFVNSAEFKSVYGQLSNEGFVTLLYQNVLGREPDAAGLSGWLDLMDSGTSREAVVMGFSESAEFINKTQADADTYAFERLQANWTGDTYRLYVATLGREPDAAGFKGWMENLAGGREYLDVITGFVASPEFTQKYGDATSEEFVTLLYQNVLDRAPDAEGLAGWLALLDGGDISRNEVVAGFARSAEFIAKTEAPLADYVRSLGTNDDLYIGRQAYESVLSGGAMSDRFIFEDVFDSISDGINTTATITDFEPWDIIAMPTLWLGDGQLTSQDLADRFVASGNDAALSLQSSEDGISLELLLLNTNPDDLIAANFEFFNDIASY